MVAKPAIAYMRARPGSGIETRNLKAAIRTYATAADLRIIRTFRDQPLAKLELFDRRPGFKQLLSWAREHGVKTVVVANAEQFAGHPITRYVGRELLTSDGFELVAADATGFSTEGRTAVILRQVVPVVVSFEKAKLLARLKRGRERRAKQNGRPVEGRKGYDITAPELVSLAARLYRRKPKKGSRQAMRASRSLLSSAPRPSLRQISAELAARGYTTKNGAPFSASQVRRLLSFSRRRRRGGSVGKPDQHQSQSAQPRDATGQFLPKTSDKCDTDQGPPSHSRGMVRIRRRPPPCRPPSRSAGAGAD